MIPAGGSLTLTVQGSGTNFTSGVTTVGFGTSDILVTQVNVISPTQLTVNVTPNVTISSANITITTGLEVISQALGSQITATDPINNKPKYAPSPAVRALSAASILCGPKHRGN